MAGKALSRAQEDVLVSGIVPEDHRVTGPSRTLRSLASRGFLRYDRSPDPTGEDWVLTDAGLIRAVGIMADREESGRRMIAEIRETRGERTMTPDAINAGARFLPFHVQEDGTRALPCVELGPEDAAVQVYAYIDDSGTLCVTVDTETNDGYPLRIAVNDATAYSTNAPVGEVADMVHYIAVHTFTYHPGEARRSATGREIREALGAANRWGNPVEKHGECITIHHSMGKTTYTPS